MDIGEILSIEIRVLQCIEGTIHIIIILVESGPKSI